MLGNGLPQATNIKRCPCEVLVMTSRSSPHGPCTGAPRTVCYCSYLCSYLNGGMGIGVMPWLLCFISVLLWCHDLYCFMLFVSKTMSANVCSFWSLPLTFSLHIYSMYWHALAMTDCFKSCRSFYK